MVALLETVELKTSSPTLDRLMLESYPGEIFESQRQAVKKDKIWYFHFTGLQKIKLFPFLDQVNSELGNEQYFVRENGQKILVRTSRGALVYLE